MFQTSQKRAQLSCLGEISSTPAPWRRLHRTAFYPAGFEFEKVTAIQSGQCMAPKGVVALISPVAPVKLILIGSNHITERITMKYSNQCVIVLHQIETST
jgi:hypothetical protein